MSNTQGTLQSAPLTSFRQLPPKEEGGRIARSGFHYQDYVAVRLCLLMLEASGPAEVWCEAEDDIVLVWCKEAGEVFEFVQVKSGGQKAWSVADLCSPGETSIYATLLGHDRGSEPCWFRLVTQWPPDKELRALQHPRESRGTDGTGDFTELADKILAKSNSLQSPKGNDAHYWARNTLWETHQGAEALEAMCLLQLAQFLDHSGYHLTTDQQKEILAQALSRVQKAAMAGYTERDTKRIDRAAFREFVLDKIRHALNPMSAGTGNLVRKMAEAEVPAQTEVAMQLRRAYLKEVRSEKYFAAEGREEFELELLATLGKLKADLDAGKIESDGPTFLSLCWRETENLAHASKPPIPRSLAVGTMFEFVNRCTLRFARLK